jgi:hypothetical protein
MTVTATVVAGAFRSARARAGMLARQVEIRFVHLVEFLRENFLLCHLIPL